MQSLRVHLLLWIAHGLLGLSLAQASDYYISPSGSDSAPGTLAQPFQTISHAASVLVAGDTAYIRAGIYRETVTPANSGTQNAPITFMPYNGESVTVSGADVIPAGSWILSSGNIYKAPMSWDLGEGANQIFLDGQMMIEAQWPNTTLDISHPTVAHTSGASYAESGTGLSTATISDLNLPSRPAGYWNGAIINICPGSCWYWQAGTITGASEPQQLTFSLLLQNSALAPQANNSYFLTGLPGELDSPGEWFRDSGTSNLSFWTPLSDSPSGHLVEAKSRQFAFDLSSRSFTTIQGISLFAATINSDPQSQYLVLDGLQGMYISHIPVPLEQWSQYAGIYPVITGIALRGADNVLRNSTVAFSSGNGVYLEGTSQRVVNNVIRDTDYRGTYASPIVAGITELQNHHLIAFNTIYNSGRIGIYLGDGGGQPMWNLGTERILHNEIYDFGLQTNDLGCTYTSGTNGMGTEIAYNLCHDGQGLLLSNTYPWVAGIYLDADGVVGSSNYVVHHNVVWNTPWGIWLGSQGSNNMVYNNTFSTAEVGFGPYGNDPQAGTTIENDIFVSPIWANPIGAVMTNNILPSTDPQFVDPATYNFQLQPTSPAIAAGLVIPPYTNGFSGTAPDIGAYDHTKPPWKAGVQNAATVSAPSYAPTLTPGTVAVVSGSVPFDPGTSVVLTDGANVDWPAPLVYVFSSPPQLAFQVPAGVAPGVAMITITNGDGTVSLSSTPLFAGAPPIGIIAAQGSGQSAIVDTLFPTALQATVKNASGTPVPDAAVTFTVPASGASGSFTLSATITTNAAGVAVAPAFVANAVVGTYTVTASAAGVGSLATFNLTNTAQLSQIISFGALSNVTLGVAPFMIAATASSGLAVSFASTIPAVCTVTGTTVTMFAAGICSINATQGGNATYSAATPVTQSFTVSPSSGGPSITPGGIVPIYSTVNTIQSGEWVSVYGTNLATSTALYSGGLPYPTSLSGTSVMIDGKSAFLYYVSPTLIDLIVPADTATGSVQVVVTTASASAAATVMLAQSGPSFFLLDSTHVAGIILRTDGSGSQGGGAYDFLGPTGNSLGYATVAAKAGDIVELFANGLGPTNPAVPAGQGSSGAAPTTNPVSLLINNVSVTPSYAGASSEAGIYQINLTIPAGLGTGDVPLVAAAGGTQTPSTVVISLQ